LQRSKGDIIFFKYWKNIKYKFRIQKVIDGYNKVSKKPISLTTKCNNKAFLFRNIISYVFSGCSIIFIGYLLFNVLNNYPPNQIGITP
jgi:hypothetical protein